MGVLTSTIHIEDLKETFAWVLGAGYNRINLYGPGTKVHKAKGLRADMALVRAWHEEAKPLG